MNLTRREAFAQAFRQAAAQPGLFDKQPRNEMERRYREWREKNPDVFDLYVRFAKEAFAYRRKFGVKLLMERVRWEARMSIVKDQAGFRVNNSMSAYISRDLLELIPELKGLIETRRVRVDF